MNINQKLKLGIEALKENNLKDAEKILPSDGTMIIIPSGRSHSAVYDGKKDRIMIGVNFYSLN